MKTTPRLIRVALGLLFFTGYFSTLFSQNITTCDYHRPKQADQWRFGDDAGISFSTLPDYPVVVDGDFYGDFTGFAPGGVSTISDEDGNLLMYCNGFKIWNSSANIMNNGDGLKGNNGATMTSLIVPNPGNEKQYYVFTVDMYFPGFFEDGIRYNLVDFSSNGNGEVTTKNKMLLQQNTQKIAAIKHSNGKDYWIITHGFGDEKGDSFYVYLLSDTLSTTPVVSKVGLNETYDDNNFQSYNNEAGYMVASPDGSMLAQVVNFDGYVELFDFDNTSGKVSNARNSTPGVIKGPYGVAFSADNSKLYVTTAPLDNSTNFLYQIDLSQANSLRNPFVVASMEVTATNQILYGALQLAPNGRIYVAKFIKGLPANNKYPTVARINNPNRPGDECNYNSLNGVDQEELDLSNGNSYSGLPAFPNDFLDIPHFWSYHWCHHDTTNFIIQNTANITNAIWNFNTIDPDGEEPSGSTMLAPEYVFSTPGSYNVELIEEFNGQQYIYHNSLVIHPLPDVNISTSDTIYILPNSSIKLDAGEYDYYYWEPDGSTDRYLNVTTEGQYIVNVIDTNCCKNADTVYVKYANLFFPNAFKPGSSYEINRTFNVAGPVQSIAKYQLRVFDRWGKMLFVSEDTDKGWDGTYNGQEMPGGVYVWNAVMESFASDVAESVTLKQSGTVTLIR